MLLFSVLLGVALTRLRDRALPVVSVLDVLQRALFGIVGMVMRLAPLAAFGAMAFTVATYGFVSLLALALCLGLPAMAQQTFFDDFASGFGYQPGSGAGIRVNRDDHLVKGVADVAAEDVAGKRRIFRR